MAWYNAFDRLRAGVSNIGNHFRNWIVRKAAKTFGGENKFSIANYTWTSGTVEKMVRGVLKTSKAILNDRRRLLSEWIAVLPAIL